MMQLKWAAKAQDASKSIFDFISKHDEAAAWRMIGLIRETADRLTKFPYSYRKGRVAGTREAVAHPNYILVYRVLDNEIEILDVLHARRQYP